jgi:hypothetical protein
MLFNRGADFFDLAVFEIGFQIFARGPRRHAAGFFARRVVLWQVHDVVAQCRRQ